MGIPAIKPSENDLADPQACEDDSLWYDAIMEESQILRLRPCFGSDERYFCKRKCQWAHQCKKLRAEWLR